MLFRQHLHIDPTAAKAPAGRDGAANAGDESP